MSHPDQVSMCMVCEMVEWERDKLIANVILSALFRSHYIQLWQFLWEGKNRKTTPIKFQQSHQHPSCECLAVLHLHQILFTNRVGVSSFLKIKPSSHFSFSPLSIMQNLPNNLKFWYSLANIFMCLQKCSKTLTCYHSFAYKSNSASTCMY